MQFDRPLFCFIEKKQKKMKKKRFSMCRNSILKNREKNDQPKGKQRKENTRNAFSMRFYSLLTHSLIYLLERRQIEARCCKTILTFSFRWRPLGLSLFITGRFLSAVCVCYSIVVVQPMFDKFELFSLSFPTNNGHKTTTTTKTTVMIEPNHIN